jgi:hypothetical protein
MPISNNIDLITLECLINPCLYGKFMKTEQETIINNEEKNFYKKRIINETKKMLKNEFSNPVIASVFNNYVLSLITYFKHTDKHDILQEHYVDENAEDVADNIPINIDDVSLNCQNEILYNIKDSKKITLDNFVISNKTKTKMNTFPKQKEIDLLDPALKKKGIKPKTKKSKTQLIEDASSVVVNQNENLEK